MTSLENLGHENRTFAPSAEFVAQANAKSSLFADADKDRLAFWANAAEALTWEKKWDQVLDWKVPFAKWFVGGKLNASYNCLDRHVLEGRGDRVAFHFEGEPGDTRTITYKDMLRDVSKAANALTELGIKAGDRVAIYMPMIPEAAVAMLGMRTNWCGALSCIWRFLCRFSSISYSRCRCKISYNFRWWLPSRCAICIKASS
jgi:acetyl-CoA synthetase